MRRGPPLGSIPTSHRLRKKERTRKQILANAIALFREDGIKGTRSIEIAEASQISQATLFNYFATKDELAEAWVRGEIQDVLDELARSSGDHGIRSDLRRRCGSLAEASCGERELRLEAWRCTGRARDAASRWTETLEGLIRREQDRGRLRADVSAVVLADMLWGSLEGGLIFGLRASGDASVVAAGLRERLDLVLDGARKRNERVSLPKKESVGPNQRPGAL